MRTSVRDSTLCFLGPAAPQPQSWERTVGVLTHRDSEAAGGPLGSHSQQRGRRCQPGDSGPTLLGAGLSRQGKGNKYPITPPPPIRQPTQVRGGVGAGGSHIPPGLRVQEGDAGGGHQDVTCSQLVQGGYTPNPVESVAGALCSPHPLGCPRSTPLPTAPGPRPGLKESPPGLCLALVHPAWSGPDRWATTGHTT